MTDIRFYHLQTQTIDQALPVLLTKAREKGGRIIVKTRDAKEAERLSEILWTFDPDSFLPHGTAKDGNAAQQPIWLTAQDENPNAADTLILTGGASSEMHKDFKLCCEIFDGRDEAMLTQARARWKTHKDAGHNLTYLQQNERGGWDTKA